MGKMYMMDILSIRNNFKIRISTLASNTVGVDLIRIHNIRVFLHKTVSTDFNKINIIRIYNFIILNRFNRLIRSKGLKLKQLRIMK